MDDHTRPGQGSGGVVPAAPVYFADGPEKVVPLADARGVQVVFRELAEAWRRQVAAVRDVFRQLADVFRTAIRRAVEAWRRAEPTLRLLADAHAAEQRRVHQAYRRRVLARRRRRRSR